MPQPSKSVSDTVICVLHPDPESQLTRPGANPGSNNEYHRRMGPSLLKGGHLTGMFLERVAPSGPLVRLILPRGQRSNKQQAGSRHRTHIHPGKKNYGSGLIFDGEVADIFIPETNTEGIHILQKIGLGSS